MERVRVRKQSGGLFSRTLTEPAGETDSPSGQSGAVAFTSEMEKMRQPYFAFETGFRFLYPFRQNIVIARKAS